MTKLGRDQVLTVPVEQLAKVLLGELRQRTQGAYALSAWDMFASFFEDRTPRPQGFYQSVLSREESTAEVDRVTQALNYLVWKGLACIAGAKVVGSNHEVALTYVASNLARAVKTDEIDVATLSAGSFLAGHPSAKTWDEVVRFFYSQAIAASDRMLPPAAQFLLGAASERAILLLGEALKSKMAGKQQDKWDKESDLKPKTAIVLETLKALERANPDEGWLNEVGSNIETLGAIYRRGRNDVGHPKAVPDIDENALRALLAGFPSLMKGIMRTLDFLAGP